MEWKLDGRNVLGKGVDVVVVPLYEDDTKTARKEIARALGGKATYLDSPDIKCKKGSMVTAYDPGATVNRVIVLGLGKKKDAGSREIRAAFTGLGRKLMGMEGGTATILLGASGPKVTGGLLASIVESVEDGSYSLEFKKKAKKKAPAKIGKVVISLEKGATPALKKAVAGAEADAAGVSFMKDLANTPPNLASTTDIAKQVKRTLDPLGVETTLINEAELKKKGFGLITGVGQGSKMKPVLVMMEHKGAPGAPVVLVGKGMVYDSGGYSLKPASFARSMKMDMSGGAAVFGTMLAIAKSKVKQHVIALVPLTENAIGSNAYRVDDILTSYSGLTVEVINTDAEGRLTLADALSYGQEFKPKAMADIATLTGGAVVVLGSQGGCIMSNDDDALVRMQKASEDTDERVWALPMWKEFDSMVESKLADVRNLPDAREASTIIGGKFLQKFVDDKYPWVHVDMAPMMEDKNKFSRGWGVRLLKKFVELS